MIGIAIGGFLGAIARYVVYISIERHRQQKKVATFLVNSAGSLLIGLSVDSAAFWVTGFLGAFTTFSTFAVDAVEDIEKGRILQSLLYVAGTLMSGIFLFAFGYRLGR